MKLRNLLLGMAIAATMLVALGAKAQPVNLSCIKIEGDGTGPEARVTFDESAGTAVFGDDLVSKAVFTDATIKWEFIFHVDDWKQPRSYILNRDTGTLTTSSATKKNGHTEWDYYVGTYKCTVAQKKF